MSPYVMKCGLLFVSNKLQTGFFAAVLVPVCWLITWNSGRSLITLADFSAARISWRHSLRLDRPAYIKPLKHIVSGQRGRKWLKKKPH